MLCIQQIDTIKTSNVTSKMWNMVEYIELDCMEPQDCFSISVVIMLNLDIMYYFL